MGVRIRKTYEYSPMERKIMDFLGSFKVGTKVSTMQIVDAIYEKGAVPLTARQSVTSVMNSLVRKIAENREPWQIMRSQQSGPHPLLYWRETRQQRQQRRSA